MAESIVKRLAHLAVRQDRDSLKKLFDTILADLGVLRTPANALVTDVTNVIDRMKSCTFGSAGLVIKTGGSAVVKGGSAFVYAANGVLVSKAANTDMAALSGTVADSKFNVFCFFGDSAGTLTSSMGTEAATLAAVVWPTIPANKAMIGFIIVATSGASFIGGTTALDAGTVTVTYVNTTGSVDPKYSITAASAAALTTTS
jgi:hypothetical protein